MQGVLLWNQYTDPIEGENLMKFILETKTKYEDKYNDTKCITYTHRRSDRPYTKHGHFMQTDCQVTVRL